ncbi:unnamed protein product [Lymnaea stagnalis]|uniref:Uncharacterized protein n=1 Tax=Lymnaea stagnalis TaxID=6523 RepID=A0AAV2HKV0_LYMST
MELARATTEAIYGGHISGRRLRGVKVNPIYEENEAIRNGDGSDTQSECGVPVGEITIEMYESLPRHRPIRLSVSAPDMPVANKSDGRIPDAPMDPSADIQTGWWNGRAGHRQKASPGSKLSDQSSKKNKVKAGETLTGDLGEKRSASQKSRWHRKKLTRQKRCEPTGDDPDAIEVVDSSPSTSGYSSPSSSFYSTKTLTPTADDDGTTRSSGKKRQLSALKEQTSSAERTEENDFEIGDYSDEDLNVFNGGLNYNNNIEIRHDDPDEDTINNCRNGPLLSGNSRRNIINDLINMRDRQSNFGIRPDMDTLSPDTQRLHRASISSLDVMNNNEVSVPDRMLQHYARTDGSGNGVNRVNTHNDALVDGIRSDALMDTYRNDALVEGLALDPMSLQGEDYIVYDTFSLRALFSLSNSSSIDSGYKAMETMKGGVHCDCGGKPTLKCVCGRAALQKILQEQHEAKKRANNWSNSVADEVTFELSSCDESSHVGCWVKSDQDKPVRPSSIKRETHTTPQKLQDAALKTRKIEGKRVTFAKGTIFNESKRVKYVKECISRTALCMRPSELDDNDERGIDNLGYEHVTGFLTDDEKVLCKTALEHPGAKNRIDTQGSLLLAVSNLNAPAYMHAYLLGFNQEPEVPSLKCETENRAAPVSIEAIGGITTDDPAFDAIGEAAEEDFEYYRRRRKQKRGACDDNSLDGWKNKRSRCRKIKICVIIVTIVVVIIAGIALAIHFGAPNTGGYGTMVPSVSSGDDVGQFSRVLI